MNMMRRFYKVTYMLGAFAMVASIVGFVAQSASSTYWFVDGIKDTWFIQEDVYAFRTNDLEKFEGEIDDAIVEQIVFRSNYPDKLHLVYFKEDVYAWDKQSFREKIQSHPQFLRDFPVVTRFNSASYKDGLWYVSDDQLLVTFRGGAPKESTLKQWKNKHELVAMNNPENMPEGGNYSYIFKWDAQDTYIQNGVLLARDIYLEDSSIIINVEPNLIKAYDEYADPIMSVRENVQEGAADKYYVVNEGNSQLQAFFNINTTREQLEFRILDLQGRQFFNKILNWQDTQVRADIATLPSGVYFSCIANARGEILVSQRFRKL